MNKETYKNYRKVNRWLKRITVCLSLTLIVISSVNIAKGQKFNTQPNEPTKPQITIATEENTTFYSEVLTEKPENTENTLTTTITHEPSTSTSTTTTTTSTETTTKIYKFADEAEEKGYINARYTQTFKEGEKYYFEVKQDSPNKTISRHSLGLTYDTGINTYALCSINGNNVCIPIAGGKMPYTTEYYFVKGFIVKSVSEGGTYWVLVADSNYIYQAGSTTNQNNNQYQW